MVGPYSKELLNGFMVQGGEAIRRSKGRTDAWGKKFNDKIRSPSRFLKTMKRSDLPCIAKIQH
ncbi:Cyclophilin-like domain containing protein [Trema orientale]|uniref:Cyclophilin-like domain containing protein n=1 Tax=Trema orientale TaxID=63057 RepID=A0A2P5EBN5_TREOI|nr:Cyclophilin-like domain containing protein [Trema orientale]